MSGLPGPLCPEEQQFAEEHHRLYLKFLGDYGLDEEYYSCLLEPYLNTVMRYCRSESLRAYRFSTILWKSLRRELGRLWKKEYRYAARDPQSQEEYHPPPEEALMDYLRWQEIQDTLTARQNETILLRNQGYSNAEIAKLCGVSEKAIEKRFQRIRKKLNLDKKKENEV